MTDPTIPELRASSAALGAELRAAIVALAASAVPPSELDRAAVHARELTAILEASTRPPGVLPPVDDMVELIRFFNPASGPGNPMAPPIVMTTIEHGVRSRVTLDRRFEGPPGFVHGGITGLLLDEVLGGAATRAGRWGMTAYLNITYRRALPIDEELEIVGRIEREEGRKTFVVGTIALASDPTRAFVEAEALFIEPKPSTHAGYFGELTDAEGNPTSARFGA